MRLLVRVLLHLHRRLLLKPLEHLTHLLGVLRLRPRRRRLPKLGRVAHG